MTGDEVQLAEEGARTPRRDGDLGVARSHDGNLTVEHDDVKPFLGAKSGDAAGSVEPRAEPERLRAARAARSSPEMPFGKPM